MVEKVQHSNKEKRRDWLQGVCGNVDKRRQQGVTQASHGRSETQCSICFIKKTRGTQTNCSDGILGVNEQFS